jgi:hypothetical protein
LLPKTCSYHLPTIYQPFITHVPTISQPPNKKTTPRSVANCPGGSVKLWSKQPSEVFEHMTFDGFMVLLWCFYGAFMVV